jgi:uncharacterized membrane protein
MSDAPHALVDVAQERLMFFSDAVFAIAITLLVIEIHVPELETTAPADALSALAHLWPSFFAYVLSFLVIGRFWMGHHLALGLMRRFDPTIMWPNIIMLMCVAFMPFATAFMAEYTGLLVPVVFYTAVLLALAVSSKWVIRIALRPENVVPDLSETQRVTIHARGTGVIIAALLTMAASFILPGPSLAMLISMPLLQRFLIKRAAKRLQADAG